MSSYSENQSDEDDEQVDWEEVDVDEIHDARRNSEEDSTQRSRLISFYPRPANNGLPRSVVQIALLLNDALLRARLLSLVPLPLVNAFHTFSPETHPLDRDRSRLFDSALKDLISWWWQSFQVNNAFDGMISRSWSEAETLYRISDDASGKGKSKGNTQEDAFIQLLESGEPIHGVKSMMKRALLMKGSRDMSAQLFTSCLRALDIPARLVFSLQPVTWRGAGGGGKSANPTADTQEGPTPVSGTEKSKVKSKRGELATKAEKAAKAIKAKSIRTGAGRTQRSHETIEGEDEDVGLESVPDTVAASSPRHTPVIKLRKSKPPTKSRDWAKSPSPEPQEMIRPPVFWTEVYSRPMKEWYCVDVTRKKMRCKNIMEPNNFIRDVTAKYAHLFGATTIKARLPSKKKEEDWFERAIGPLKRPYKLGRDTKEDTEMEKAQVTEAMPTTVTGFKNHPKYALERHLRREEVIYPKKPMGTFRGDSVYHRSSVIVCKSTETYMREGKRVKGGETPLKMVKPRAVTINRRRETELFKMDGQPVPLQGLFAEWQTELLIPPPIVDGIIPRNSYGNFDLFAPHMLPQGAKHLPYKGIAKTAKKLKISYADAVVSFEFHRSRATPLIDGIIVPELEAEFVLDAYWTSAEAQEVKELEKLEERCLKRWKKLIIGLRIRQRLQQEYGPQGTQVLGNQKSIEGTSKSRHTDSKQPEISTVQASIATSSTEVNDSQVPFELYTDHQMNIMVVPQPANGDDHSVSNPAQPDELNKEEPIVADVLSSPLGETTETQNLDAHRSSSSNVKNHRRLIRLQEPDNQQGFKNCFAHQTCDCQGTKRKSSPALKSDHILPFSRQTSKTTRSQRRGPRQEDRCDSITHDVDNSSPLTSPLSDSDHSEYNAITSQSKRAKTAIKR
ncbi:hypothetical protein H4Q26_013747 [Puccinia striiformis f. sp. tritici PST-130]|nr:hypothetical protein H4Q26_013747 [Puccinia striiformis f. sp. tritici PST-130]